MNTWIIIIIIVFLAVMGTAIVTQKGSIPGLLSVVLFSLGFSLGFIIDYNRLVDWVIMAKNRSKSIWEILSSKFDLKELSNAFTEDGEVSKMRLAKAILLGASIIIVLKFVTKILVFIAGVVLGLVAKLVVRYYGISFTGI